MSQSAKQADQQPYRTSQNGFPSSSLPSGALAAAALLFFFEAEVLGTSSSLSLLARRFFVVGGMSFGNTSVISLTQKLNRKREIVFAFATQIRSARPGTGVEECSLRRVEQLKRARRVSFRCG